MMEEYFKPGAMYASVIFGGSQGMSKVACSDADGLSSQGIHLSRRLCHEYVRTNFAETNKTLRQLLEWDRSFYRR